MLFVDNEGTKFSLLRGPSDNTVVDFLAEKMVELEASVHAFTWLARVPSSCSVADAPSGGRINGELLRNGVDVSANVKRILDSWVTTQLMSLGRTAAHQSHLQKGSVRIEHLERVLMRTSLSLGAIHSDVKCHSPVLQTFSFKWRVGGLSLSLRSFNDPPPSPFTTFSTLALVSCLAHNLKDGCAPIPLAKRTCPHSAA